jgi:hypothetical protein
MLTVDESDASFGGNYFVDARADDSARYQAGERKLIPK